MTEVKPGVSESCYKNRFFIHAYLLFLVFNTFTKNLKIIPMKQLVHPVESKILWGRDYGSNRILF